MLGLAGERDHELVALRHRDRIALVVDDRRVAARRVVTPRHRHDGHEEPDAEGDEHHQCDPTPARHGRNLGPRSRSPSGDADGTEHLEQRRSRPACRGTRSSCRTSATARTTGSRRRTGSPARARARRAATCATSRRTRARRCRRRPGSRRTRRSSGRRSAGAAPSTPRRRPSGRRSRTAGSRPMSACSAACTAPITRPGSIPASYERVERHRVPARARRRARAAGSRGARRRTPRWSTCAGAGTRRGRGARSPHRGVPHRRRPATDVLGRRSPRCRSLRGVGCTRRRRRRARARRRGARCRARSTRY